VSGAWSWFRGRWGVQCRRGQRMINGCEGWKDGDGEGEREEGSESATLGIQRLDCEALTL